MTTIRTPLPRPVLRLVPPLLCLAALAAADPAPAPAPALALEPGEFDPAAWQALLDAYVKDGRVDYAAWKANGTEALNAFLDSAKDYDLTSTLGKEPRAAFLINAYNAFVIRQVLDHYPVGSVKEIPGFLDTNAIQIAGESRTLNGIAEALAKLLPTQPQYAFLLVPGTSGWPTLSPEAVTSKNYPRLTAAAGREMVLGGHVAYDEKNNVLHIPVQVSDHIEAYDELPKGLVGFLSDNLPLSDVVAISNRDPEHVVDPVDWTLNDTGIPGGAPPDSSGGKANPQ